MTNILHLILHHHHHLHLLKSSGFTNSFFSVTPGNTLHPSSGTLNPKTAAVDTNWAMRL